MRFVWAVVAFVLATLLIGAGIAQRTVFLGPSEQRMELSVEEPQPYVLVDAEVLAAHDGLQKLLVRGDGDIFVAYGRTTDMTGWLSDTSYAHVTLSKSKKPQTAIVEAQQPPASGATTSGRNPAGSDLWLDSFVDTDSLVAQLQLTSGHSVLIARDGAQPAPTDILVSWRLDNRTPFAGPLMAAGGVLLVVGLVLYVLGIIHQRRGAGPRRKGPGPLPETQPLALDEMPERKAVGSAATADAVPDDASGKRTGPDDTSGTKTEPDAGDAGRPAQRTATARRRRILGIPAVTLVAALATGCSADSWPEFGAETPTPTPSTTAVVPEDQKPPVITRKQGQRIVSEIAATIAKADADLDIALAETRMTGDALEGRRTEYTLRGKIQGRTGALTTPQDKVRILLPEATESWPRTVLALTKAEDDTVPPVLMTMTQNDPWSNYRVVDMADMPASSTFPDVAPDWLGTTRVPADSPFLSLAPSQLAGAFADYVDAGDKSAYASAFDEVGQKLAASVRESRANTLKKLAENKADKTSKITFDMTDAGTEPLSMATLDSGAVVAVSVRDSETVTPTQADAVIRISEENNPAAVALTGVKESAKGFVTTYSMQLFFAVPAQGSKEQIRLLAYHQDLLSVKVIK